MSNLQMHDIEMYQPTIDFARCWDAAGRHLQATARDVSISWLKADLKPPFLEHISFRIGNQLFFVRIEDVRGELEVPGNRDGLLAIADGCKGNACLMPMKQVAQGWISAADGWGLIDLRSGAPVCPEALVTDEKIEMTDWEVHDLAVQVVGSHVSDDLGHKLISYTGHPEVNPSIWFLGASGLEWIVVRAMRHPCQTFTERLGFFDEVAKYCAQKSRVGHLALVKMAGSNSAFNSEDTPATPLWRGHRIATRFGGLNPFPSRHWAAT